MNRIIREYQESSTKQKIAIITAIIALVLGFVVTGIGFAVPPVGEISSSVLWVLGQCIVYAASVFGITGYLNAEARKLRKKGEEETTNN